MDSFWLILIFSRLSSRWVSTRFGFQLIRLECEDLVSVIITHSPIKEHRERWTTDRWRRRFWMRFLVKKCMIQDWDLLEQIILSPPPPPWSMSISLFETSQRSVMWGCSTTSPSHWDKDGMIRDWVLRTSFSMEWEVSDLDHVRNTWQNLQIKSDTWLWLILARFGCQIHSSGMRKLPGSTRSSLPTSTSESSLMVMFSTVSGITNQCSWSHCHLSEHLWSLLAPWTWQDFLSTLKHVTSTLPAVRQSSFIQSSMYMKYILDGWTKNDLIYVWKQEGALQFAPNLSLPGGFILADTGNQYCDVKTSTGEYSCLQVNDHTMGCQTSN